MKFSKQALLSAAAVAVFLPSSTSAFDTNNFYIQMPGSSIKSASCPNFQKSITHEDDWGGITCEPSTDGQGIDITVMANRHKSGGPANFFKQGLSADNMAASHTSDKEPGTINFAVEMDLQFQDGEKYYTFPNFRLGQGHSNLHNMWWVGTEECVRPKGGDYHDLNCEFDNSAWQMVAFASHENVIQLTPTTCPTTLAMEEVPTNTTKTNLRGGASAAEPDSSCPKPANSFQIMSQFPSNHTFDLELQKLTYYGPPGETCSKPTIDMGWYFSGCPNNHCARSFGVSNSNACENQAAELPLGIWFSTVKSSENGSFLTVNTTTNAEFFAEFSANNDATELKTIIVHGFFEGGKPTMETTFLQGNTLPDPKQATASCDDVKGYGTIYYNPTNSSCQSTQFICPTNMDLVDDACLPEPSHPAKSFNFTSVGATSGETAKMDLGVGGFYNAFYKGYWHYVGLGTESKLTVSSSWTTGNETEKEREVGNEFSAGIEQSLEIGFLDDKVKEKTTVSFDYTHDTVNSVQHAVTMEQEHGKDVECGNSKECSDGNLYQWYVSGVDAAGNTEFTTTCSYSCVPARLSGPQYPPHYCSSDSCQCAKAFLNDNESEQSLDMIDHCVKITTGKFAGQYGTCVASGSECPSAHPTASPTSAPAN